MRKTIVLLLLTVACMSFVQATSEQEFAVKLPATDWNNVLEGLQELQAKKANPTTNKILSQLNDTAFQKKYIK